MIDTVPPPPPPLICTGPTLKKLPGLDWLLYSVAIQSLERAVLETRSSSSRPLNGKMAPYPLVDRPPATTWSPVLTGAVPSALDPAAAPSRYIFQVDPSKAPTRWCQEPVATEPGPTTPCVAPRLLVQLREWSPPLSVPASSIHPVRPVA